MPMVWTSPLYGFHLLWPATFVLTCWSSFPLSTLIPGAISGRLPRPAGAAFVHSEKSPIDDSHFRAEASSNEKAAGFRGRHVNANTPMKSETDLVDVTVIGGGLAGMAASIHLADAGLRVVCIEADPVDADPVGESLDWSAPACRNGSACRWSCCWSKASQPSSTMLF